MGSWFSVEKNSDGFDRRVYVYFGSNTFMNFENDWHQLFGMYNWKTYRFAEVYYENDIMTDGKEFVFVLFGLGFRVRHNNPGGDNAKALKERIDSLTSKSAKKEKKTNSKPERKD